MAQRPSNPSQPSKSTIKSERENRRAEKVAKLKKQQAREKRNRTIGVVLGSVAGLAVIATIVTVVVTGGDRVRYSNLAADERNAISIADLDEQADLPNNHIDQLVDEYPDQDVDYEEEYGTTPPMGGNHLGAWLTCGEYDRSVPEENAVHSLEHGAIWVTYDPELDDETLQQLRDVMPSNYYILSPYEGMETPIALSAWGAQLKVDSPDDERVQDFITKYWRSPLVPEPGAACAGAFDAPGLVT